MNFLGEYWIENNFNEEEKAFCYNILGDKDEKISLEKLLDNIRKIDFNAAEKQTLIAFLCDLIVSDMHIDDLECEIIDKMAKRLKFQDYKNILSTAYSQAQKTKELKEARKRSKSSTLGLRIRSFFSFGKAKEEIGRKINRFILQGPKFGEAIRCGAAIAVNDMIFISNVIEENSKVANECLESAKKSLKNDKKIKIQKRRRKLKITSTVLLMFLKTR